MRNQYFQKIVYLAFLILVIGGWCVSIKINPALKYMMGLMYVTDILMGVDGDWIEDICG